MKFWLAGLGLMLCAGVGVAAPVTSKGVDAAGRRYVMTLTGTYAKKDLPPDEAMEHAGLGVAAYLRAACLGTNISRCDVYAGYDDKLVLPPGYVIAVTTGGVTRYHPEFMHRGDAAPRFSCLAAGKPPPAAMTGKNVLEGEGPVVLLRDGASVRLSYNKAYGCKVDIAERFDLIGSMVFEGK